MAGRGDLHFVIHDCIRSDHVRSRVLVLPAASLVRIRLDILAAAGVDPNSFIVVGVRIHQRVGRTVVVIRHDMPMVAVRRINSPCIKMLRFDDDLAADLQISSGLPGDRAEAKTQGGNDEKLERWVAHNCPLITCCLALSASAPSTQSD